MPYLAPSYFAPSYFGGLAGTAPAVQPYLFKRSLIDFLTARLGVPVAPNGLPAEGGADPMLVVAIVDGDTLPLLATAGRSHWTTVQIDAWGTDEGEVETLAARLYGVLHFYRGPLGTGFIQSAIAHRAMDSYDPPSDVTKGGDGWYRSMREFRVFWNAPA